MVSCFLKEDFFVTKIHKMNFKDKKIESLLKKIEKENNMIIKGA